MPQRACIFCGATGKLTREHIYPRWMHPLLGSLGPELRYRAERRGLDGETDLVREWTAPGEPADQTIREVCGPCNNGWMSRLQARAKPILTPMLEGHDLKLRRPAQTALGRWAAVQTIVRERLDFAVTPQAEREWVMRRPTAPRTWRIWFGRHTLKKSLCAHRVLTFHGGLSDMEPPAMLTTTMTFGQLVVHTMSTTTDRRIVRSLQPDTGRRLPLLQVWPSRDGLTKWPPGPPFHERHLHMLADGVADIVTEDEHGRRRTYRDDGTLKSGPS